MISFIATALNMKKAASDSRGNGGRTRLWSRRMTLPQTKDTADLVADLIRARIEKERRALSRRVAWGVLEGRAIIAALEDLLAEAEALA